eukprot:TRINITY_DN2222_c0_g1_i1.p1 TRINITY_DN2222_c0_g1~~TRINITY_DN2222_c0_g1_i1.p1  ORF type:complete len:834 (-),score=268.26 TRINITY_DN2222_c0_g1_i1:22-2523(-)
MDLLQLRNLCKRDPEAYREEFQTQLDHFESQLKIYQLKPSKNYKSFQEQATFLSHVAPLYASQMKEFPGQISKLLDQMAELMEPELRKSLVKALILLRNRGLLEPIELLSLLFKLFRVSDKELRAILYTHIISDIKNINSKSRNNKINNVLQNFMFKMVQDKSPIAAKKAHEVMIDLYKRKIWKDAKVVNAISLGVFSGNTSILVATVQFFLGTGETDESDSDDDEPKTEKDVRFKFAQSKSKKTRAKARKLEAALLKVKKKARKKSEENECNFAAIELLHDPQGYAEKCYRLLKSNSSKNTKNERFEVRLMLMNLISRLISVHKLILMEIYPYFQKFLEPKQQQVTYILAVVVQSCHDLIPPETLSPIVRALADKFISDRSSNEAVALGINTVREICLRCPLVMEADLLQDLAQYKRHKDKGVVMAARSLINLYQTINPSLLARKDRGKDHDINATPLAYGQSSIPDDIQAVQRLQEYIAEHGNLDDIVVDESDSDEGDWENVSSDDEIVPVQPTKSSEKKKPLKEVEEDDEDGWEEVEEGEEEGEENEEQEEGEDEDGWEEVSDEEEQKQNKKSKKQKQEATKEEEDDEDGWEEVSDEEEQKQHKKSKKQKQEANEEDEEDEDGWQEVSEDEDDQNEGGWKDVSGSDNENDKANDEWESDHSDEENIEAIEEEQPAQTESVQQEKPLPMAATTILTQEMWEKARKLEQMEKKGKNGKKRTREEASVDIPKPTEFINPIDLVGNTKKARKTAEERMKSVLAGREGREEFKARKARKKHNGGTTNEQKSKNQPFMLAKHSNSVRGKRKRSVEEQQRVKNKHKAKVKNQKKYKH